MAKRPLNQAERALWRSAMADVARYRKEPPPAATPKPPLRSTPAPAEPKRANAPPPAPPASAPAPAYRVERATLTPPPPPPAGLDRRTARRLRKGALEIDGRLDLHGLTQARAHDALVAFVERKAAAGARCVIVVTGKGGAKPGRVRRDDAPFANPEIGVLRAAVPRWLAEPRLSRLIVASATAAPHHGGAGALYLYLRRARA